MKMYILFALPILALELEKCFFSHLRIFSSIYTNLKWLKRNWIYPRTWLPCYRWVAGAVVRHSLCHPATAPATDFPRTSHASVHCGSDDCPGSCSAPAMLLSCHGCDVPHGRVLKCSDQLPAEERGESEINKAREGVGKWINGILEI